MTTATNSPRGHPRLVEKYDVRSLAVEELDYRIRAEQLVRKRLQRAKAEGDLPKDSSPADLARYLRAVICGMAVQSADGATRRELQHTADMAMRAWPR